MKTILFTAMLIMTINFANAQNPIKIIDEWQKPINVTKTQEPIIDQLVTSWGKEFPGIYIDAYSKFKQTGKANGIKSNNETIDFKVKYSAQQGYFDLSGTVNKQKGEYMFTATYWNLLNGNKLFGVCAVEGICICGIAIYEYDTQKNILIPRPDIVNKIWEPVSQQDSKATAIILPTNISNNILYYGLYKGEMSWYELYAKEETITFEQSLAKTIQVPKSESSLIEQCFTAWSKEFPTVYSKAFNKYEQTGKAEGIEYNENYTYFKVELYSEQNLLLINGESKNEREKPIYSILARVLNLSNGNKLFHLYFAVGSQNYVQMFYEYDTAKCILTPRTDINKKVWDSIGEKYAHKIGVTIDASNNNIIYYDPDVKAKKVIKWTGNGY